MDLLSKRGRYEVWKNCEYDKRHAQENELPRDDQEFKEDKIECLLYKTKNPAISRAFFVEIKDPLGYFISRFMRGT